MEEYFQKNLSLHIEYDKKHTNKLFAMSKEIIFPALPEKEYLSFNTVRLFYQGTITGSIFYKIRAVPYYALVYTFAGDCRLTYDEQEYTLPKGSIAFLNLIKECSFRRDSDGFWTHSLIIIDGSLLFSYYRIFYQKNYALSYLLPKSNTIGRINNLSTLIRSSHLNDMDVLITHKLITDLLTSLILEQNIKADKRESIPNHVTEALSYINLHYKEKLSLLQIADHVNISKYTLAHDFSVHTGSSVMEYVSKKRIEEAKLLLSTTGLSVMEIGYQLGYSNDAHFVSSFKQKTGLTPLRYRKQHNARSYDYN